MSDYQQFIANEILGRVRLFLTEPPEAKRAAESEGLGLHDANLLGAAVTRQDRTGPVESGR